MHCFLTVKRLFLLGSILACLSCSHNSGSEPLTLTGKAPAGDALVWLDLDGNWSPDPGEPQGRTSASGDYALRSWNNVPAGSFLVVRIEVGRSTTTDGRLAGSSYLLAVPAGSRNVSVWTTMTIGLIAAHDAADMNAAHAMIRNAFGLSADFDFSGDPADGLEQAVQTAYGKSADNSALGGAAPSDTMIAAAHSVMASSSLILELADLHASPPPAPTNAQPVEVGIFHGDYEAMPINTNMAYGTGFDEASRVLKSECTTTSLTFQGLCANQYDYTFDLIQTQNELSRHASVGASASAGVSVGGFDIVSATGEFQLVKNTTDINDGLYILFREEQRLCGYPSSQTLKPEWAAQFAGSYDTFHSACGDRYLSSITSGGVFTALVKVKLKENEKLEELRLTLSAKVLGVTVFKKTWKDTLHDINLDHVTETRVHSNLFAYSDNLLTVQQVFDRYDEFTAAMQNNACSGPEGWKTCAYLATFSRYETLSVTPPEQTGAGIARTRLANMQSLERYYFETEDLIAQAREILLDPNGYNIGANVDGFSTPNGWTVPKLETWQTTVSGYQQSAMAQWSICYQNIKNCDKDPAGLNLPSWLDLKAELPTRKFTLPQTCGMLAEQFGIMEDGEHWLYLGGDVSKSYRVYCTNMATSQPQSYLKLFTTSGNIASPVDNYSSLHYSDSSGTTGVITRVFDALLVEPCPLQAACIQLIPGQAGHTVWTVAPISAADRVTALAGSLDVLEAQAQGIATASANLNLTGTPLKLSTTLVTSASGTSALPVTTVSADRKKIDLSIKGGAAGADTRIRLEWSGNP